MLSQNLLRHYLYIVIRLPKLKDLEQKILTFPNCDNYGIQRSSNPNLTADDIKLNDNALHQQFRTHFKVDYLEKLILSNKLKDDWKRKLMRPYWLFYPTKLFRLQRGWQLLQVQRDNCTLALEKRELSK